MRAFCLQGDWDVQRMQGQASLLGSQQFSPKTWDFVWELLGKVWLVESLRSFKYFDYVLSDAKWQLGYFYF